MVGFSTRLREKIESTRFNAAASHASSNNQPKNIRGLTRLSASGSGTVAPSVGLLSGRSNTSSGAGGSITSCNAIPSKESGRQERSISVVYHSSPLGLSIGSTSSTPVCGPDNNTALLGGSKIVPGWGAGNVTHTINAPSGHLGGIKSRDHVGQKELRKIGEDCLPQTQQDSFQGKRVPWALHQPSPVSSTLPHTSLRRRWCDEEDDSDDEFPQIRSEICKVGEDEEKTFSGSCHQQVDESPDDRCERDCEPKDTRISSTVKKEIYYHFGGDNHAKNSHPNTNDEGGFVYSRSCGRGEEILKENKSSLHKSNVEHLELDGRNNNPRGNQFRIGKRWGNNSRPPSHYISRNGGVSPDCGPRQSTKGLHLRNPSTCCKDPVPTHTTDDRNHQHDQGIGHDCGRYGPSHKIYQQRPPSRHLFGQEVLPLMDRSAFTVRRRMKQQLAREPNSGLPEAKRTKDGVLAEQFPLVEKSAQDEFTPLVLLRSCDSTRRADSPLRPADISTSTGQSETQHDSSLGSLTQSCQIWSAAQAVSKSPFVQSLPLGEARDSESSCARKQGHHSPCMSDQQKSPTLTLVDKDQEKKVQAKEQQQNILRQVVHRRAAATASSRKCEIQAGRAKSAQWERGLKLTNGDEEQKCSVNTEKLPSRCGVERLLLESMGIPIEDKVKVSPNKSHKSERCSRTLGRRNQKLDGFSGDSGKSQAAESRATILFPRSNPCRIEGHDHDWNDCPHNPKSESFIRNNPCRIDGHGHDWIDCVDNPKSDNYVKPIKKGRKGTKHCSPRLNEGKKHTMHQSTKKELPDDGKELSDAGLSSKDVVRENVSSEGGVKPVSQGLPVMVKAASMSLFVPAPQPVVSAWTSGPPTTIAQHKSSKSNTTTDSSHISSKHENQATCEPEQEQKVLETKLANQTVPRTIVPNLEPGVLPTLDASEKSLYSILPPHGALFPGNAALFGESQSDSVYTSWCPPPTILLNTCVDPWKPNSFATKSLSTSLSEEWFGSIWSHDAISLVTLRGNKISAEGCVFNNSHSRRTLQFPIVMGVNESIVPNGSSPKKGLCTSK